MSREKSDVYHAPADDQEMDAAMDRAQSECRLRRARIGAAWEVPI